MFKRQNVRKHNIYIIYDNINDKARLLTALGLNNNHRCMHVTSGAI